MLCYEMLAGYPPFYDEDPLGIYQKILEGKIKFPWHFDRHSKDLIKKLLTSDLTKRLGNLKNGADDFKKHKYFSMASSFCGFKALATNPDSVTPPITPEVSGENDTSQFDKYPDSEEGSTKDIDPADQERIKTIKRLREKLEGGDAPAHERRIEHLIVGGFAGRRGWEMVPLGSPHGMAPRI